ncbi:unnamed protein product [Rotaria sp. Silwood2]|nr:unnamed protein product [Rotaria sp. Silwood2]
MATSQSDDRDEVHLQQGSCNIILKPGDLLNEKNVDVLVIPTPANDMNPDNFQLFKSIYSKADQYDKRQIDRVCSNLTQPEPRTISIFGRQYIFAVPPYLGNREKAGGYLKKTYTSCLKLAIKNNFQTIAFPTIGCGVIGFPINDAASNVYLALENFCQSNGGKKMNEIRIIIYDPKIYNEFTGIFIDMGRNKNIKLKCVPIYPEDFDNDDMDKDRRSGVTRQTSNLNPDIPEFQPKNNNKQRNPRHFSLSNNRTELIIIQGDILTVKVDAIVNAANESMLGGSGVDGAIHKAAGNNLRRACEAYKQIYPDVRLPTGHSRILLSYDLYKTAYYIINTAGPCYDDAPPEKCKKDLISCYKTSLALANLYDLETIAFTAISCGIFGYPIDEGAEVALTTVDKNAGMMRKILFVLKDDNIYDAWVKKAEELSFTSLDKSSAAATRSTLTQTQTKNQNPIKNNESTVSNKPSELKVIDASTADNTHTTLKDSTHAKSSKKSPQDPDEKSESQETMNKEKFDSSSNKTEKERPNRCIRCLVFIQRHINLLQYRESECSDADDLSSITSCPNMIAPDAALYTLHRNDSKPQLCPIQPPFILTNLIKDSSVCHQSISSSYINECVNDNQFHLYLTPCLSYQPTLDLQFVCVGTWIEDFHTYFVARIISHSIKRQRNHRNNQYACFVILILISLFLFNSFSFHCFQRFLTKQKSSLSLSLNMATDDSCRDLYSKHMSTVMTLTSKNRQITNESTPYCIFSNKFQSHEWYSINGTIQMIIKNTDIELIEINKRFYCYEMISSEKTISIYRIQTFTNCDIKEECLHIIQRTNNVIELYTFTLLNENNCYNINNDNYNLYLTFFTKSFTLSNSCPSYINDVLFQSNINFDLEKKSFYMSIDCNNKQKLTISQNEKDLEYRSINEFDTCLASWQLDDPLTTYFIAQSKHSNAFYCFSFQLTNQIIIRNNRNDCSFANHNDEESFSMYSVYVEHFCSQSQKLISRFILLLIAIGFSISNFK